MDSITKEGTINEFAEEMKQLALDWIANYISDDDYTSLINLKTRSLIRRFEDV